jgi:PPK2 family polyphosphate:nucleotide phosphotransferase
MDKYRVKPDTRISLDKFDSAAFSKPDKADKGARKLEMLAHKLYDLQERLYAERRHKLLIILQGMDTAGKDGTIRHVFSHVNPQGVRVACFKKPTLPEAEHDFLWRVHMLTPAAGEIIIFNRSHYEDVLIQRVHKLVPKAVWSKRYDHINAFERLLTDEGTVILKFFLHISYAEQKKRLLERLNNKEKQWKLSPDDISERKLWPAYIKAYEAVFERTSTPWAPWYIIPADHKWYRNLMISTIIVAALEGLDIKRPQPQFDLTDFKLD